MGRRKLKYARSNIRFWHEADELTELKVHCERKADIMPDKYLCTAAPYQSISSTEFLEPNGFN